MLNDDGSRKAPHVFGRKRPMSQKSSLSDFDIDLRRRLEEKIEGYNRSIKILRDVGEFDAAAVLNTASARLGKMVPHRPGRQIANPSGFDVRATLGTEFKSNIDD